MGEKSRWPGRTAVFCFTEILSFSTRFLSLVYTVFTISGIMIIVKTTGESD